MPPLNLHDFPVLPIHDGEQLPIQSEMSNQAVSGMWDRGDNNAAMPIKALHSTFDDRDLPLDFASWQCIADTHFCPRVLALFYLVNRTVVLFCREKSNSDIQIVLHSYPDIKSQRSRQRGELEKYKAGPESCFQSRFAVPPRPRSTVKATQGEPSKVILVARESGQFGGAT